MIREVTSLSPVGERAGVRGGRPWLALFLLCAAPVNAGVTDAAPPEPPAPAEAPALEPQRTVNGDVIDETTLQSHRTFFEALSERMIGVASRAVRYDWRKATVELAVTGSQLLELNNFNSSRIGLAVRAPLGGLMIEFAFAYVHTWGSVASDQLSRTPYRQAGRPSRFEADLLFGHALAEGVTTPRFGFIPPTELVFLVNAGLRYRYYPHELDNTPTDQAIGTFFAPKISDREVQNLEYARLPGMQIDRSRYDLLVGFSLALYFQNGAFIAPRVMFAPPVLSAIAGSSMTFWWDLSLSLGWSI